MAATNLLVSLALIAALVTPALATDFLVGDESGWKLNFDYKSWAATKEFHVDDKLIFKYLQGAHNVRKADLLSFQNCTNPENDAGFNTGNDVITLASEGKKWYLCSVGTHCSAGMKLAITVLPQVASPAAAPVSTATGFASYTYFAWITAAFGTLVMIMF